MARKSHSRRSKPKGELPVREASEIERAGTDSISEDRTERDTGLGRDVERDEPVRRSGERGEPEE